MGEDNLVGSIIIIQSAPLQSSQIIRELNVIERAHQRADENEASYLCRTECIRGETLLERKARLRRDELDPISIWGDKRSVTILQSTSHGMCYRITTESDVVEHHFVRTVVRKVTPEELFNSCTEQIHDGIVYSTVSQRTVGRFRNQLLLRNSGEVATIEGCGNAMSNWNGHLSPDEDWNSNSNEVEVVDFIWSNNRKWKRRHMPTGMLDGNTGKVRRKRRRRAVSIENVNIYNYADKEVNGHGTETGVSGQVVFNPRRDWSQEEHNISDMDRDKF